MLKAGFNVICLCCLILFVSVVVLWVRSYSIADDASLAISTSDLLAVSSNLGMVEVQYLSVDDEFRDVIDFAEGAALEFRSETAQPRGFSCWDVTWRSGSYSFAWNQLDIQTEMTRSYVIGAPYWIPAAMSLILPTMWLWKRPRPSKGSRCRTCNYDLRGSVTSSSCPECGHAIAV